MDTPIRTLESNSLNVFFGYHSCSLRSVAIRLLRSRVRISSCEVPQTVSILTRLYLARLALHTKYLTPDTATCLVHVLFFVLLRCMQGLLANAQIFTYINMVTIQPLYYHFWQTACILAMFFPAPAPNIWRFRSLSNAPSSTTETATLVLLLFIA